MTDNLTFVREGTNMLSILLLDCSSKVEEDLKKQGFKVEAGTAGYASGVKSLPSQLYEHFIIIYNPSKFQRAQGSPGIKDLTPEFELAPLSDHILKGATCLVFMNRVSDHIEFQRLTYKWIETMPKIDFTKDNRIISQTLSFDSWDIDVPYCKPLISEYDLKKPVLQKLSVPKGKIPEHGKRQYAWLYSNYHDGCLGVLIRLGHGRLIILPEYNSNDEIIKIFAHRVIPQLYDMSARKDLSVDFKSPEEEQQEKTVNTLVDGITDLEKKHEKALEKLEQIKRDKINTIQADNTAKLALQYLDLAYKQEDVALHFLYKIAEVIEKKLGGEKEAKNILGTQTERNFIGTVANESYGDMRHAPSPGEVIKPWDEEQIKQCFTYSEIIISRYLATLFKKQE